jgi:competence protein ComEC
MPWLLPALAGAFVSGIALGDRLGPPVALSLWAGLQLAALAWLARGPRVRAALAAAVALAAGAAAIGTRHAEARRVPLEAPRDAVVDGRVARVEARGASVEVVLAEARAAERGAPALPSRLLVRSEPGAGGAPWRPGSWVRVALRIAPMRAAANPGGADRRQALARRGIGAVARERDPRLRAELAPPPGRGGREALRGLRARAAARLAREGRGGALLAALGVGDAAGLEPTLRRALARLGLAHLVAVSGLHLWLVAGPAHALAAAALRRSAWLAARIDTRRPALGLALAVGAGYALLSGWAVPVQRALAFLALLAASQLVRRRLAPPALFGAAGLAIAASDPAAPFAPGVQLSFVATAALVFGAADPGPEAHGAWRRAAAALRLALRTSAAATAATAPLVALHFGSVSPLGWLANGVAVPLTALVGLPLALLASGLAMLPASEAPPLAHALGAAAALAQAALDAVLWLAARVPARAGVSPGALGLALAVLAAGLCLRARRTAPRLGFALLAAAAPAVGPPPALAPPPPRAVFLDVGQGDATLVQGRRAAVLVDAGVALPGRWDAGERVVVPALGALGVRRLALVAASHADLDHAGGLAAVLEAVPAERLWLPPGGRTEPAFAPLLAVARARGVAVEERAASDPPRWFGDVRVEALWPRRAAARASRNDASLVLRLRIAGCTLLLPGDLGAGAERALAAAAPALRADVLKLAHHGSRTSSSAAFLAAVSPALAVVSAPRHGRFGMPHAEVRARLSAAGIPWRWTGRDGAVRVALGPRCGRRPPSPDAG